VTPGVEKLLETVVGPEGQLVLIAALEPMADGRYKLKLGAAPFLRSLPPEQVLEIVQTLDAALTEILTAPMDDLQMVWA
jgi:hypothetical protein